MSLFVVGTLVVLALLAWATYHTAQALRETRPDFNLLLLPAENFLRLALIAVCVWLGRTSGLSHAQLGWEWADASRDVVIGVGAGIFVALILPSLAHRAVARFGAGVYSPIVILCILPRNAREWLLVPLALVPAVLLEELLFRSLLLGGLAIFVSPFVLAIAWSLIFGAMHSPQGALGIVVAAALGLLLSALFLATASLLAPFLAHYVINFLQLVWASRDKTWLEKYATNTSSRS
jgi:membrane protease YdiL (CAAX protease family)